LARRKKDLSQADRLERLCANSPMGVEEIASRLGIHRETLRRWRTGAKIPGKKLRLLCEFFRVRFEWLESGEGPMRDAHGVQDGAAGYRLRENLGGGHWNATEETAQTFSAPYPESLAPPADPEALKRRYGLPIEYRGPGVYAAAVRVRDGAPDLEPGDVAILQAYQNEPLDRLHGLLCVVELDRRVLLRRLSFNPDGEWITLESAVHPPDTFKRGERDCRILAIARGGIRRFP